MADWSNLPQDIWILIAKNLSFLRDLNSLTSVCIQYRDVAKQIRESFMSRPPLLMLPFDEESHTSSFYDLATNTACSISLPQLHDRWICGASNGWLVTLDDSLKIELLNPYSKAKLQLPQHPAIHHRNKYRSSYMQKVILTESPSSNGECFAVSIVSAWDKLAICRVGDDRWTDIKTEVNQYQDITCYKGKIFAARSFGPLVVVDPGQDYKITVINAPEHPHSIRENVRLNYLVESSGDLLMVLRVISVKRKRIPFYKTYRFHVYRLNESMRGWSKVENLGNRSIFVGLNRSLATSVSGLHGCRPNCIYYLDDYGVNTNKAGCQIDCGLFCLEDGCIEPLPKEVSSFWSSPGFWCAQSL